MSHIAIEQPDPVIAADPGCGHSCTCSEAAQDGYPELDARLIPHAVRHAAILGALDSVTAGAGLILVAPHDPVPLLAQINDRYAGAFTVRYLTQGPDSWRVALSR
jgi:uncharacterized protein (DUF2249 family)